MSGSQRAAAHESVAGPPDRRRLSGRDVSDLARILAALSTHPGARRVTVHGVEIKVDHAANRNSSRQQQRQQQQRQQDDAVAGSPAEEPPRAENARARRHRRRAEERAVAKCGTAALSASTLVSQNPSESGGQQDGAQVRRTESLSSFQEPAVALTESASADAPSAGNYQAPQEQQQNTMQQQHQSHQPQQQQQLQQRQFEGRAERAGKRGPESPGSTGSAGAAHSPASAARLHPKRLHVVMMPMGGSPSPSAVRSARRI